MNWISFLLAVVPIVWLLISLGVLKMQSYLAAVIGFAMTVVIAVTYFSMPVSGMLQASAEGMMMALFPILWVILSALFVYNTSLETGAMDKIKTMLTNISPDRRIQGLILAFAFGGFLESVAGFGTAVAIPAGILAAMGFSPMLSATICLIANTVPVAFGVLGIPITTLAQVTSLPLAKLAEYAAFQLIPMAVVLPLVIVFAITGSVKKIKGVFLLSVVAGVTFSLFQTLIAIFIGPELAAVVGSLMSLVSIILMCRLFPVKNIWRFEKDNATEEHSSAKIGLTDSIKAWSPYLIVLVLVFAFKFLPFLGFFNQFPFVLSGQFYFGTGGKPMSFPLVTSAGTILFIAAVIGGLVQGASVRKLCSVFLKTVKQIRKTIVTVLFIMALAKVMSYSDMVNSIANTLAAVSGRFYPLIAPLLGALGTFITGSDTSSNALFGNLQKQTAANLAMNPEWLAAGNASGATIGKMISPQSISIASAATDLGSGEGKVLRKVLAYCAAFVVIQGIFVFLMGLFVSQ